MTIVNFTPVSALIGGALIGLSASLLWWSHGRIAGISSIWANVVSPAGPGPGWRLEFVAGLAVGGLLLLLLDPAALAGPATRSVGAVAAAGVLVGVGTRMASGCTSGHGICGLVRLRARSLAAVITFMAVGFALATALGFWGGA